MNAQQLRNSILQEAIEGRLVPQDPNDEPASALLERIREEKKQLVKEGKLKKKDLEETPISEDEKPFEIPDSWEWCKLGNVISLLSGRDLTPQEYSDKEGDIPYITGASNFDGDSLIINRWTTKPVTISKYGDLLITCKGTIGTMSFNQIGDIHIARQVMAISPYIVNIRYIRYFLMRIVYELEKKAKSIIPGISREDIINAKFPLPPLAEQKRIVAKIEELLPKVEEYGKAQDALNKLNEELPEKLKKSVLQEAITGKLVPQDPNDEPASTLLNRIREEKKQLVKEGKLKKKDIEETPISEDEIPFEIPESWVWVRMQDVIEFVNGRAYKRDELLDKGKYKVLRVGNFFTNESWYYSDLELPDEKYCYKDDLLYAWSASFGPKIWDGDKTIFHYHIWNVRYNKIILFRDYLFYFFLIDKESIKSATTGSTMVHVSMENMKPRLLPLPPLAEQKRIVAKIEEVFAEIDKTFSGLKSTKEAL